SLMISFFRFLGIRCQFGCFDFSCFLMIRLISFSFIKPLFGYQSVFADLCTIIEAFFILTKCINSFTCYFFQHPFYGEIKDPSGNPQKIIEAQEVYFQVGGTTEWDADLSETVFRGNPFDLKITQIYDLSTSHEDSKLYQIVFRLTPCNALAPVEVVTPSYTGEVTVKKNNNHFTLPCGYRLIFDHHYRYLKGENGDRISFPELVAECKDIQREENVEKVLQELDDFLMITSFAERQRCVCLGYKEYYNNARNISHYRRRAIPDFSATDSDTLIDIKYFDEFISTAFESFQGSDRKDFLRQAIFRATEEDGVIESKFLSIFSSIETLVLYYQTTLDQKAIFSEVEWKQIFKDTKKFFKGHKYPTKIILTK
ncbi:MAG: hypothetical protein D3917_17130, partial [Candidatus Electrothrix sp. AX5]|nr:hypothetical protein [Candidatus Electrothrix sp. AX5]